MLHFVLTVLLVIMTIIAGFLGKELLKKFKIHEKFAREGYLQKKEYQWEGKKEKKMRTFVLQADNSFSVLIGFRLKIPVLKYESIDWFGSGESKKTGERYEIKIATYTDRKPIEFIFYLCSKGSQRFNIRIEEEIEGDVICPPHWFQTI